MGKHVIKNPLISIDGVELQERAKSVTVTDEAAKLDSTAFGGTHSESQKGLRTGSIQIDFFQDFDAASVDATLAPINAGEDPVEVLVVPTEDAISATNPGYRMSESHLFGYSPLAGSVGEMSATQVTFENAGQSGLERLETPPA